MTLKHGRRVYIQVLLEPNRGKLFLEDAERLNKKPSALMREIVYQYIKEINSEQEAEAAIKDQQVWQAAVQARLDGRARNRANALKASDQSEQAV